MKIPISILTGFLGSGKTTLLKKILTNTEDKKIAVIINEFGEISLDHALLESGGTDIIPMPNGCVCCKVSSDLIGVLQNLHERKQDKSITYDQVVIETSGLADPAPLLHLLLNDSFTQSFYSIKEVITMVDSTFIKETIDIYPEVKKQIIFADRILISKTDISSSDVLEIELLIKKFNTQASISIACELDKSIDFLDGRDNQSPEEKSTEIKDSVSYTDRNGKGLIHDHDHTENISSAIFTLDKSISIETLTLFLQGIKIFYGQDLMRAKGIIYVGEFPDTPLAVNVVHHVIYPYEFIESTELAIHNRLVIIGKNIRHASLVALFECISEEVELTKREMSTA